MAEEGFYETLQKIRDQYPAALALLSQPGVFKVYADAIAGGWSPERLDAALEQTEWWLSTPAPARQWQALQATDPVTAERKAALVRRMVDDAQRATGVTLSQDGGLSSMAFTFFADAVREGWDATEIRYRLLASVNATPTGGGELGQKGAEVKRLANDYGLPMSDGKVMAYAKGMLQGAWTPETLQGDLIMQAKSLYPTIAGSLDKGMTVRQFADPYLQLAERELGVDSATVDLTDQKWIKMLNQQDPKTGERVPMTTDQWLSTIRSDPTYGYAHTSQGKQSASTLAQQLQAKMGAAT